MAKEEKLFTVGNNTYNVSDIIDADQLNLNGYLDSSQLSRRLKRKWLEAHQRYIDGMKNGSINSRNESGEYIDDSGIISNKNKYDRAVAYYFNRMLPVVSTSADKAKEKESIKEPLKSFDYNDIKNEFFNQYFPGSTGSLNLDLLNTWLALDQVNEDGTRSVTHRLNEFKNFLENYKAKIDKDTTIDWEKSQDKSKEAYLTKLNNAINAINDGTWDQLDGLALSKIGISSLDKLFSKGNIVEKPISTFDKELNDYRASLEGKGIYTPEEIDNFIKIKRQSLLEEAEKQKLELTEDFDWQNYANNNFTSTDYQSYSFNSLNLDRIKDEAFWLGNYGNASGRNGEKGEYDKDSFFDTHKDWRNKIIEKLNASQPLVSNLKIDGVSENEFGIALMKYLLKYHPDEFIQEKDGSYLYKASIQPNKGIAYKYNDKTDTLHIYHVNKEEESELRNELKRIWKSNRYASKWEKGGKIDNTKILTAADGTVFDKIVSDKLELDHEKIAEEAKAAGKSEKRYRAGNRHISMDTHDNWDLAEFNDEDYARLVGLGADIAGLIASFTGVGTVANVGTGLVSTAANLYADISDESVSSSEALKGLGTNLALSAVGFLPGGNSVKILKLAAKLAPKVFAFYNAARLATDPEILKSWAKTVHSGDENRMTVQDWKNIAHSISTLRAVTHISTNAIKSKKYATATGKEKIKNTSNEREQLTQDASRADKIKASLNDKTANSANWIKSKISPSYKYDDTKVLNFLELHSLDAAGKWSDANMWWRMQNYTPTILTPPVSLLSSAKGLLNSPMRLPRLTDNIIPKGKFDDRELVNPTFNSSTGNTIVPTSPVVETIVNNNSQRLLTGKLSLRLTGNSPRLITGNFPKQLPSNDVKSLPNSTISDLRSKNLSNHDIAIILRNLRKLGFDVNLDLNTRQLTLFNPLFSRYEITQFKQGGLLEKLKTLRNFDSSDQNTLAKNDGIVKALYGGPADWHLKRYGQHILGGEDLRNANQMALSSLKDHNKDWTLGTAFSKNQAYTSNKNAVGSDIQSYYNSTYKGLSLDENEFDLLNDELKKARIHKVDLGDGTLGYVYKKANGNIEILPDNLKYLVEDSYTTPTTTLKEVVVTTPSSSNTKPDLSTLLGGKKFDMMQPYVKKLKSLKDMVSSKVSEEELGKNKGRWNKFTSELRSTLTKPNLIELGRFVEDLNNNKRMVNTLKKGVLSIHKQPVWSNPQIITDYASLLEAIKNADNIESLSAKIASNTSDASLGAASMLLAKKQSDQERSIANIKYWEPVYQQAKQNYAELRANQLENRNTAFENASRDKAAVAAKYQLDAQRLGADQANRDSFSSGIEYRLRERENLQKQFDLSLLLDSLRYKLLNDEELKKLAANSDTPEGYREWSEAYDNKLQELYNQLNLQRAAIDGFSYNPALVEYTFKPADEQKTRGGKSGMKITKKSDNSVKRAKLFYDSIKHLIDSHLKNSLTLSKSTLSLLKKALDL